METLTAIVAGRVSTKDQADKGYSLPEQVTAGLAYIQERGYVLADVPGFSNTATIPAQTGVFIEDFTGMSMDRPALDAIRDVVKQYGVKVIVFTETDRLARKRIYGDLLEIEFEELGARVEYSIEQFEDSDEGRLFKDMKKAIGEYERVKILRRMRTGMAGRVKSGKVLVGDRAPYGYRKSDDGTTLVICETEAETVRLIYRWYIEGITTCGIAARLNTEHVPTYAGPISRERRRGWQPPHITNILANETYAGTWFYGKHRFDKKADQKVKKEMRPREEWIGAPVPRIIDDETFAMARARAERNKANATRNRKRLYLFSGMIKCSACHWSYGGNASGSWQGYHCRGVSEKDTAGHRLCWMPKYNERDLHAAIWPWLVGILKQPEQAIRAMQIKADEQQAQAERLTERLTRVDAQLAEVRRRIANLDDQLEVETDDESRSALRERKAQRVKARRELEAERVALTTQIEQQPLAPARMDRIFDRCKQFAVGIDKLRPAEQRATYEDVCLAIRLEVRDGMKLAHVTCIVGEESFDVGSGRIVNVALRYNDHNAITFATTLVIGPHPSRRAA